jgi:hypothetical protein
MNQSFTHSPISSSKTTCKQTQQKIHCHLTYAWEVPLSASFHKWVRDAPELVGRKTPAPPTTAVETSAKFLFQREPKRRHSPVPRRSLGKTEYMLLPVRWRSCLCFTLSEVTLLGGTSKAEVWGAHFSWPLGTLGKSFFNTFSTNTTKDQQKKRMSYYIYLNYLWHSFKTKASLSTWQTSNGPPEWSPALNEPPDTESQATTHILPSRSSRPCPLEDLPLRGPPGPTPQWTPHTGGYWLPQSTVSQVREVVRNDLGEDTQAYLHGTDCALLCKGSPAIGFLLQCSPWTTAE